MCWSLTSISLHAPSVRDRALLILVLRFRARALRPRQIVFGLRPLLEPAGPAQKHLCHPLRRDAELLHRDAAIDGFAVLRDQAVAHDETAHAVDHDALSR